MSPIEASQLQVTVTEGERWRRTLDVTVPADVVEAEKGVITRQLASRLKVKGFRSGRVPTAVVAKRYGPHVEREALDQLIRDAFRQAVSANDLAPISEGEIEDVSFSPKEPLSFRVSFDVRPIVHIERLGGFKVQRPAPRVPDDGVDRVLDRLRDQSATWASTETGHPVPGDRVVVELTRLDTDGDDAEPKEYEFVLGEGNAIPEVESAIATLEPGAEGDFSIAFPEDFPDEERRGESQQLRIRLLGRQAKELPDVDDAFARTVGDFQDLETLRAKILEDLEKDAERQSESALRGQLLESLLAANPFEVPQSMVDGYLSSIIGDPEGIDPDKMTELRGRLQPDSELAVKRMLLIDRITEQEGLKATEEDIDARIEEIAEKAAESPSKVYANLQKSGRLASLEQDLTEEKLFEFLKSQSEISEAP